MCPETLQTVIALSVLLHKIHHQISLFLTFAVRASQTFFVPSLYSWLLMWFLWFDQNILPQLLRWKGPSLQMRSEHTCMVPVFSEGQGRAQARSPPHGVYHEVAVWTTEYCRQARWVWNDDKIMTRRQGHRETVRLWKCELKKCCSLSATRARLT